MNMARWKFTGAVKSKANYAIDTITRVETVREFAKRAGISIRTAYRVWWYCRQYQGENVMVQYDVMMFRKEYSND